MRRKQGFVATQRRTGLIFFAHLGPPHSICRARRADGMADYVIVDALVRRAGLRRSISKSRYSIVARTHPRDAALEEGKMNARSQLEIPSMQSKVSPE